MSIDAFILRSLRGGRARTLGAARARACAAAVGGRGGAYFSTCMICDLCSSRSAVALFDTRMCCVDVGSGYLASAGPPISLAETDSLLGPLR